MESLIGTLIVSVLFVSVLLVSVLLVYESTHSITIIYMVINGVLPNINSLSNLGL